MAEFSIREVEGMRQIRIDMYNETVRARRGALSNMRGNIQLIPRPPSPRDLFRSIFTSEARIRPYYTGTGSILLQPSLGGYHILTVGKDERWILEPGSTGHPMEPFGLGSSVSESGRASGPATAYWSGRQRFQTKATSQ
jgi:uncharacterized protein (AIM24 family)